MNFLNHKFQVVKEANIIIIKNCISNNALVAFEDKGLNFDKFKEILYYGKNNEEDKSLESSEMKRLIKSFPFGFTSVTNDRMNSLFIYIRQYTEFFLPSMLSNDLLEKYINRVEEIISNEKKCNVFLSLDSSYPYLSKLISEIPYLNVIIKDDDSLQNKYDLVIAKGKNFDQDKLWADLGERILFLNVNQKNIEIGPLVFSSKFEIPDIKFELFKEHVQVLKQEELLVYFFLERILYINFFELYDKISGIDFFPTRSRICIDRLNLHGHGELVPMYPFQNEA